MYLGELSGLTLEESSEPEILLPNQFFSEFSENSAVEGERRLMSAILGDAVQCYQKYALASDARGQRLFREAEEWLMERDTGAAFTFEYICEARGLDAEAVRSGLRQWRERRAVGRRAGRDARVLRPGDDGGCSGSDGEPELDRACGG